MLPLVSRIQAITGRVVLSWPGKIPGSTQLYLAQDELDFFLFPALLSCSISLRAVSDVSVTEIVRVSHLSKQVEFKKGS